MTTTWSDTDIAGVDFAMHETDARIGFQAGVEEFFVAKGLLHPGPHYFDRERNPAPSGFVGIWDETKRRVSLHICDRPGAGHAPLPGLRSVERISPECCEHGVRAFSVRLELMDPQGGCVERFTRCRPYAVSARFSNADLSISFTLPPDHLLPWPKARDVLFSPKVDPIVREAILQREIDMRWRSAVEHGHVFPTPEPYVVQAMTTRQRLEVFSVSTDLPPSAPRGRIPGIS